MNKRQKILSRIEFIPKYSKQIILFLSKNIILIWQFVLKRFRMPKGYLKLSKTGKICFLCTISAIPLAILFFVVQTVIGPTRGQVNDIKEQQKQMPKQIHDTIVETLREQLAINKTQVAFPRDLSVEGAPAIQPTEEAKKTAEKIPDNAGPYALAMKAVAESKFDKARGLAEKAADEKEVELAEIYRLRGEIEIYAGNYKAGAKWYKEALRLACDDKKILLEAAGAFGYNVEYKEAEPLYERVLKIDEKALGKDHPDVARDLNNLAGLYLVTNRSKEAEPLMKRAITIAEKAYGENHPNVAVALNNLAMLYLKTNRLKEAEPLMKRVVDIFENPSGQPLPNYAGALNNLAALYLKTNQLKEAEPLMKRVLAIDEKTFGKDHPDVARDLNNLAQLYKATNRGAEARPLLERALSICEKSLGPEHSMTITMRRNLEGID